LDDKHKEDSEKVNLELEQIAAETQAAMEALDLASKKGVCVEEDILVQNLKRELEMQIARQMQEAQEYDDNVHKALGIMVDLKEEVELVVKRTVDFVHDVTHESELLIKDHIQLVPKY